jgi:hypothetical protein
MTERFDDKRQGGHSLASVVIKHGLDDRAGIRYEDRLFSQNSERLLAGRCGLIIR